MKWFLQVYELIEKCFIPRRLGKASLGKHFFLPSLVNRMIRMSKEEEMRKKKNERNNVPEGSRVKVNLNRTPRITD